MDNFPCHYKGEQKPKFDMSSGRLAETMCKPLFFKFKVNPSVGTCECAHVSKRINRREMIYLALGQTERFDDPGKGLESNATLVQFRFAPKSNLNCFQNCTSWLIDGHLSVQRVGPALYVYLCVFSLWELQFFTVNSHCIFLYNLHWMKLFTVLSFCRQNIYDFWFVMTLLGCLSDSCGNAVLMLSICWKCTITKKKNKIKSKSHPCILHVGIGRKKD